MGYYRIGFAAAVLPTQLLRLEHLRSSTKYSGRSTMMRLRTVCLVAVALAAGGFFVGRMLVAQDKTEKGNRQGRGGAFGNRGLGKLDLLKNADVQKDLSITDEQKTTLSKFTEEMQGEIRKQLDGLKDLSQEDRRAKLAEMRSKLGDREAEVQKKLEDVLNTSQRDRLAQIELQAELAGNRIEVFSKKEVAEALEITDEQKQKLTELREKVASERREAFGGGQGGPPSEDARAKMKKLGEETMGKAKEILTSEQREKLEKMTGKKVDFDLSELGGFGGGRGGRRGRGGAGATPDKTPEKSTDKPADTTPAKTADKTDAASPSK
jgi:Spy/CpxP family protein refolding chaperone